MQADKLRRVWFIRHAESVANAGGRTSVASIYPLSERGFRQAEQLAQVLPPHADLVVFSPYVRARQTAEPFLSKWRQIPAEEWTVQEVQYLDPAECVDTTQDQRRVLAARYWEQCDCEHAAPGAESFVAFIDRAKQTLEKLARRTERHTYIFCHGHFIGAIKWLVLTRPSRIDGEAMRRFYQFIHGFAVPNCAVLPAYLHPEGELSLGGMWVPAGVDTDAPHLASAGLAGL